MAKEKTAFFTLLWIGFSLFVSASLFASQPPEAMSAQIVQFSVWDSRHNPGHKGNGKAVIFDTEAFIIESILIPMNSSALWNATSHHEVNKRINSGEHGSDALIIDIADYLPEKVREVLEMEVNGKKYIRYFFSPDDTKLKQELLDYLDGLQVEYLKSNDLWARRTASKSLLVSHPDGYTFSVKPSTHGTSQGTGDFERRPTPTRWAYMIRRLSDYFFSQRKELRNLDVAWEPASIGFYAMDQSNTIRLMDGVSKGDVYQMSAFVLRDEYEMKRLAAKAGKNYNQYMQEAYRILGQAMVELTLGLGFKMTSAHSQNIRLELDTNFRWTGRAVILDLSDGSPQQEIFTSKGKSELIRHWRSYVPENAINSNWLEIPSMFFIENQSFIDALYRGVRTRLSEIANLTDRDWKTGATQGKVVEWGSIFSKYFDDPGEILNFKKSAKSIKPQSQCLGLFW